MNTFHTCYNPKKVHPSPRVIYLLIDGLNLFILVLEDDWYSILICVAHVHAFSVFVSNLRLGYDLFKSKIIDEWKCMNEIDFEVGIHKLWHHLEIVKFKG